MAHGRQRQTCVHHPRGIVREGESGGLSSPCESIPEATAEVCGSAVPAVKFLVFLFLVPGHLFPVPSGFAAVYAGCNNVAAPRNGSGVRGWC